MIKKIIIAALLIIAGIYIGFQMPRGANLLATVSNLSGDTNTDYSQTKSHQALLDLIETIDNNRKMVLKDARTEQEAIEGMRWIMRVLAMATEVAADANPRRPHFQRMDTEIRKVGGDNPDAEYHNVSIDGQYDYLITGNVGDVTYFSFTVAAGQGMTPRYLAGFIADRDLTLDDKGNFTLILSKQKPEQDANWIQIPEDASGILVREYIANRKTYIPVEMNIEVLGGNPDYTPPSDEEIANSLIGTSYAYYMLSSLHKLVLPELMTEANRFIITDSDVLGGAISSEDNLYMIGSFQIADDEALIVKATPPKTRYWNLTLETRWHETYDYLERATSRTLADVEYSEDGTVEFMISHKDTGHPNWLDTSGHNFGFMTFRWLEGKGGDVAPPSVNVVKLADLENSSQ